MKSAILTEGSIIKHLTNLAVPALIGLICTFSFIIVDTYFISLLGNDALIAISYVTPISDLVIGISLGVGIATTSVISRKIGSNDLEDAKNYLLNVIIFVLILGIILLVVGILNIHNIFLLIGANEQSIHLIYEFMFLWFFGVPFILLWFVGSFTLRSFGIAKLPAMLQIATALTNLILDPIFIFVLDFGIAGAAIAGLIARISFTLYLVYWLVKNDILTFKRLSNVLEDWKKLSNIALPAILTNIIAPVTMVWITYLIANTSQYAVAGFGIASKVQLILVIPLFVLSGALSPIVGQNFGGGKYDRVKEALMICCKFSLYWGIFVSIILWFVSPYIGKIFSTNSEVIYVSNTYLYVVPISYIAWGIIMMINSTFNAVGKPKTSLLISLTRMIFLFFPLSYISYKLFDFYGLFIAFSVSTFLSCLIAYILIKKHMETYENT